MPGTRKLVTVEGRGIVVLNIKGELFALSNTCPHKGASLCNGLLTGLVRSTKPGEYQYERAGEILRCPWHQWEFDVRTGRSYCDPRRLRLMQFPIAIEAGARRRRRAVCRGNIRRRDRGRLHRPRCALTARALARANGLPPTPDRGDPGPPSLFEIRSPASFCTRPKAAHG